MKKFSLPIVLVMVMILTALISCGDDDDSSSTAKIYMKANVDGKRLDVKGYGSPGNTKGTTCVFQESNATLYLTGNDGIVNISMAIKDFPKSTGTFTIGTVESGNVGTYIDTTDPSTPVSYFSVTGTLTVTHFDGKSVRGTFSFTADNESLTKQVEVTAGEFELPFVEI